MNGGSNMLYTHFTEELLGLQGVKITNIENEENNITIYLELERKSHSCPCCGTATDTIHDYRLQKIKDIPSFGKNVVIKLRKRRYRCPNCGKRFYENNSFLPKYRRMTNRLVEFILYRLTDERSFTSVAREVNLSVPTVIRVFDLVNYPKAELPRVLSIDEFKGNTWGEKYQSILTDPENKIVLDILPERYKPYLTTYFSKYSKEEREKVEYFISDMWRTYYDTSGIWFKNATRIVDKYHWIRQVMWAFDSVRKDVQKKLGSEYRKYFKRSRKILFKRFNELSEYQKQKVMVMLSISPNLYSAHFMKEEFFKILDCKDHKKAKELLLEWMDYAKSSNFKRFQKCADTFYNWFSGIINSLNTPVTNGFTEGCNNKIKVLKRNAYGYKNFSRFRKRILHIFN